MLEGVKADDAEASNSVDSSWGLFVPMTNYFPYDSGPSMIATASPTLCAAWSCQPTHSNVSFVLLPKSGCAGCYVDDPV